MVNKTVVYLVRHGVVPLKDGKAITKDPSLSEKGIIQAKFLANEFLKSDEKIDLILTSTMKRAIETARIVSSKLKIKVISFKELSEYNEAVFNDSIFSIKHWNRYNYYKKSLKIFNRIIKKNEGKNLLFIIHGQVIKGIVGEKLKIRFRNRGKLSYNNCHITRMTLKKDKISTLSYFNSKTIL